VPEPRLLLDLRDPHNHLVQVRLRLVPSQQRLRLSLPAWTPGSYLIRDYVRTLEGLELWQGEGAEATALPLHRTGVAAWEAELPSLDPLELRYAILATELSVRTCHLDGEHGFLALAGVVLQPQGERWSPWELELALPAGWRAFVPLPELPGGRWRAANFDQLIDTPIEAGPHPVHSFSVAGVPHRWVSWGGDLPSLDPSWLGAVERVCLACCRLMGEETPASDDYLFVLHLREEAYGGLEHDHASVLQFGRRALAKPDGWRRLLQLVAHEYLHQWNVRRLRPAELCPIDYDRPVISAGLWFAEGITSYVDQLLPLAAGLCSEAEVLEDLGADLSRYRLTPGRQRQSLRSSSQEAWVKLYRQDAHSIDNQVSYYLKGAVLALVLDLHLRRAGSSLPRVLRDLWRSHGRCGRGYRDDDLTQAFASHAADLSTLLPEWLNSTEDPPVDDYLADVGVRLVADHSSLPWCGWQLETSGGGVQLQRVLRHGPAQRAGLQVGDELLAVRGRRLRCSEDLEPLLRGPGPAVAPGDGLELLICRDGLVQAARLEPEPAAVQRWRLEADPASTPGQLERRRHWLELAP